MDPTFELSRSDPEDPRQGEQLPPRDRWLGCVPNPRTGTAQRWSADQVEPLPVASLSRRDADYGVKNTVFAYKALLRPAPNQLVLVSHRHITSCPASSND